MQEYKLVVRGLTDITRLNVDGSIDTQNPSEFSSYLYDNYLSQGWGLLSVDLVRFVPEGVDVGTPRIYEFAYHLVREVPSKAKASKE